MYLTLVHESLLVTAYYRGGNPDDGVWGSNCDQVVTLSLFYTGEIPFEECAERFSRRSYVGGLYDSNGQLNATVKTRYRALIELIRGQPDLIQGGGDLNRPADPTYTSCRLTHAGGEIAATLISRFPRKPDFPNWPDRCAFSV